ncbi:MULTISPECIES: restriction endonuclease [Nocardia]|uniref:restriction endonuclease n=1 Tax=Nocardia TaxID=1817 RepID=UPI00130042AB|nr:MULTISPECIES: restriction endonuclease [Nocardia]
MVELSSAAISNYMRQAVDPVNSTYVRGRAYEDVMVHIFESIAGCETQRNSLNRFGSEEVDIAVMNFREDDGLRLLPEIFLVECKNWSNPVDSSTVSTFATKIRHRGCSLGVLVAANGVTGNPHEQTRAYHSAALALNEQTRILLLTTDDLTSLTSSKDVVSLLHRRLLDLVAAGTFTTA